MDYRLPQNHCLHFLRCELYEVVNVLTFVLNIHVHESTFEDHVLNVLTFEDVQHQRPIPAILQPI
ncbi:unnamed protein product [Schistosoma mattheei]|uniref:Uncharacterized protein n=1 Tax=Schistosoma mattheei TaxID=31246 RepID=A0A3P7YRF1_9TREM|nr:unnamed protein product [Schistosoma mattheei]